MRPECPRSGLKRLLLTLSLLGCARGLEAQSAADSLRDARAFTERFYAWYVPVTFAEDGLARVLKERRDMLSDSLYAELKADADAQGKAREIVGFNADPFLLSQDPCSQYRVGSASRVGSGYRFRVECATANPYQEGVIAEVAAIGGAWRIVNVHPLKGGRDLRSALRLVAEERRQSPQTPFEDHR